MDGISNEVQAKFDTYPEGIAALLLEVRDLVYEIAGEEGLGPVTESLKWGELSYSVAKGSPIRVDWKPRQPECISVFVNCKTVLVETFRELHPSVFTYVGSREVRMSVLAALHRRELKQCLSLAMRYHRIKHLPLLGA